MLERSGLREDTGQVRGGEKDPFPILVTLCAKPGLVRISRKDNKSIILHLERRTKGPGHPEDTPTELLTIQLVACVAFPNTQLYPHGSAATGEGRALVRYRRGSQARTAPPVVA